MAPKLQRLARVGEGQIRASPVAHLPAVLRELGFEPGTLFEEAGFDPALLRDPETTVPFRAVGALLTHCVERTGRTELM